MFKELPEDFKNQFEKYDCSKVGDESVVEDADKIIIFFEPIVFDDEYWYEKLCDELEYYKVIEPYRICDGSAAKIYAAVNNTYTNVADNVKAIAIRLECTDTLQLFLDKPELAMCSILNTYNNIAITPNFEHKDFERCYKVNQEVNNSISYLDICLK